MKVGELCELLGVDDKHIYPMAARGLLPSFHVGGAVRFDPQEVAKWLRGRYGMIPGNGKRAPPSARPPNTGEERSLSSRIQRPRPSSRGPLRNIHLEVYTPANLRDEKQVVSFSGTIDPGMGTASALSDTLFGRTRGAILRVLYGHVAESFYLRQLARRTEITLGAVQRELRQLVEAGLVIRETVGHQTFYRANQTSPVFEEMRSLVAKTVGVHDVLLKALRPLEEKISLAFVYGSTARSKEKDQSDVDLMVVGRVHFADVIEHLAQAQKALNREINPTVYSTREFRNKVQENFLKTVLREKKLFLIGDESVVRELGK